MSFCINEGDVIQYLKDYHKPSLLNSIPYYAQASSQPESTHKIKKE